jgi:hypothetical protein
MNVPQRLLGIVERESARLRGMGGPSLTDRPAPGSWCPKEILGHLVDSASNNHQRFVRAALAGEVCFPGYVQDGWGRCPTARGPRRAGSATGPP